MSSTALSGLRWVSVAWCALGIAVACGEKGNEDLFADTGGRRGDGRGGSTSGGSSSNESGGDGAAATGGTSAGGSGASTSGSGGRAQPTGGSASASPTGGSGGASGGRSSGGSGKGGMFPNGGGGVAGSTGGVSGGDSSSAGSESGGASAHEGGAANSAGAEGEGSAGAAGDTAAPRTIQIGALEDAYVDGCETGRNTGSDETLSVDSDPCVFEIYVKPASLSDIPSGATVESALLELQCIDTGNAVRVLRITDEWSEESVDWDSRPSLGDEIGSFEPLEQGPVFIDITALVTEWLEGAPIHGVALVQGEETDGSDYPSTEAGEPGAPRIVVTYTP